MAGSMYQKYIFEKNIQVDIFFSECFLSAIHPNVALKNLNAILVIAGSHLDHGSNLTLITMLCHLVGASICLSRSLVDASPDSSTMEWKHSHQAPSVNPWNFQPNDRLPKIKRTLQMMKKRNNSHFVDQCEITDPNAGVDLEAPESFVPPRHVLNLHSFMDQLHDVRAAARSLYIQMVSTSKAILSQNEELLLNIW